MNNFSNIFKLIDFCVKKDNLIIMGSSNECSLLEKYLKSIDKTKKKKLHL